MLASSPASILNHNSLSGGIPFRFNQPRKRSSQPYRVSDKDSRIRTKAGLPNLRIHDLRHTFASIAASGGESLMIIGRLLGHTQVQTTERYAHLAPNPLRKSADRIADEISWALRGGELSEKAANCNEPNSKTAIK
jgi:integrase